MNMVKGIRRRWSKTGKILETNVDFIFHSIQDLGIPNICSLSEQTTIYGGKAHFCFEMKKMFSSMEFRCLKHSSSMMGRVH